MKPPPIFRANGCDLVPTTPADDEFLHHLFVSVQMVASPLPQPAVIEMLNIQHSAQTASYRKAFPHATDLIIRKAGQNIGRLLIDYSEQPTHLIDIALLPEWQGQGIGTDVVMALIAVSRARGADITLKAIDGGSAQRLYARLGFKITDRAAPYATMRWSARQGLGIRDIG